MNVARQYETIEKLRALAEHPGTPPAEAESARVRMEEIEAKIRADHEAREAAKPKPKKKVSVSVLKKKKRKGNGRIRFPVAWPFGWEVRGPVEVERMDFDSDKKIVLGWKCPGCQMLVEREITPKHRARLRGKQNGVDKFIEGICSGVVNQLCDACWKKHQ